MLFIIAVLFAGLCCLPVPLYLEQSIASILSITEKYFENLLSIQIFFTINSNIFFD